MPELESNAAPSRTRTPLQIIGGALGSGKTTLLRRLLSGEIGRVAVLVNEFGELGIDGQVIGGRDVDLVELAGGCVCCSLAGEFEAAIEEILARVAPELILVETTGVAEADALVMDIEERLPQVRIDAVVVLVDADVCARFPSLGYTERTQIAEADLLVLNKVDLVSSGILATIRERLEAINPDAALVTTSYAAVDPGLLAPELQRDRRRDRATAAVESGHIVDHGLETFTWRCTGSLSPSCFEEAVGDWPASVYRSKGVVRVGGAPMLFNYVAGRWTLEPASEDAELGLVWIGPDMRLAAERITAALEACRE